MRRGLAWLGGALGLAALLRLRRRSRGTFERRDSDPADELRARLELARDTPDDRDEFDAAEGQPVDEVEAPRSIEERRRAIHEQAERALGEMQRLDSNE
jgi:hypothetical protein